jgi:hypothetical protein
MPQNQHLTDITDFRLCSRDIADSESAARHKRSKKCDVCRQGILIVRCESDARQKAANQTARARSQRWQALGVGPSAK